MSAPGDLRLDVHPAPSAEELAAIVAAMTAQAGGHAGAGEETEPISRWRRSGRRYDQYDDAHTTRMRS